MQSPEHATNSPPKRPHSAGDLRSVRVSLWWALRHAEYVLSTTRDESLRLRAVHAVTQASLAYCKVHETLTLDARVEALERLVTRRNGHEKPAS